MTLNGFLESDQDSVTINGDELLGVIDEVARLDGKNPRRKAFANKILKQPAAGNGMGQIQIRETINKKMSSKRMLELYAHLLDEDVRKELNAKTLQVIDYVLVSSKPTLGKSAIEMFTSGDTKIEALRNVAFGKLEKTSNFLVRGITILTGIALGNLDDDAKAADFGKPDVKVVNGYATFRIGGKTIYDYFPLVNHAHNRTDVGIAYVELETPKMIKSQEPIVFDIKCSGNMADKTWIKVLLHGAITTKN